MDYASDQNTIKVPEHVRVGIIRVFDRYIVYDFVCMSMNMKREYLIIDRFEKVCYTRWA